MDQPTRNSSPQPACDFSALPVTRISITALYSEDATRLSRNEAQICRLEEDFRRRMREHPGEHPVYTPLRVLKRSERFLIVAGNYRYFAALRIPLPDLPCQVLPHDLDGIRLFIEMHRDNALHEDYSPVETARNILHVKDQLGCSQAEAGRLLGVENSSDVTKLLSVLKRIPRDLLDKIGEGDGKLPFTHDALRSPAHVLLLGLYYALDDLSPHTPRYAAPPGLPAALSVHGLLASCMALAQ
jgi:hypothetical protein